MQYLSAYYREEDSGLSLVLQQVTRQRGKVPILFAGIWGQQIGERKDWGCSPAEQMTEWFYEKALAACEKKDAEFCVDAVQGMFVTEYGQDEDFSVFFAMGRECFYAWRGEADIRLFNLKFDRLHVKSLTRLSEQLVCERALWEPETGLVLGMRDFFDKLPEESMKACFAVREMEREKQLTRHLAEAAQEAARRGAKETAALFVVAREG